MPLGLVATEQVFRQLFRAKFPRTRAICSGRSRLSRRLTGCQDTRAAGHPFSQALRMLLRRIRWRGAARCATLIDVSFPLQSASVFLSSASASAVCFVQVARGEGVWESSADLVIEYQCGFKWKMLAAFGHPGNPGSPIRPSNHPTQWPTISVFNLLPSLHSRFRFRFLFRFLFRFHFMFLCFFQLPPTPFKWG